MPAAPPGGTILVAEDDHDLRGIFGELLREAGYGVLEARDGGHTVALARTHEPALSLILLDWSLPDLRGDQVVRALGVGFCARVPVVLAAAAVHPSVSGFVRGALGGPCDVEAVLSVVARHARPLPGGGGLAPVRRSRGARRERWVN